MTFECTLNVNGVRPEASHKAFIKSYQQTSNNKYYQRHDKYIKNFFNNKITKNISQNDIPKNLSKSFSINFKNEGIYFSSNSKQALRYEFGAGNIPPKRFIEPAFIDTANKMSEITISDAIKLYEQYTRFT